MWGVGCVGKLTYRSTALTHKSKADEVKRLYEAGLTVRQIAKTLDLSTQGVYWHLERLELPPPSKTEEVAS